MRKGERKGGEEKRKKEGGGKVRKEREKQA